MAPFLRFKSMIVEILLLDALSIVAVRTTFVL